MNTRPLSPFLNYRFAHTMLLSFSHRVAGIGLAVGLLALTCWLIAIANGPAAYQSLVQAYAGWPFKLLLCAWLFAFLFHFANGIRHLFWDAGLGMERAQTRQSALVVVIWAVVTTVYCLWVLL
jgi:succinate dehydrogenase / fumarate reductase, cytochrome b subunit